MFSSLIPSAASASISGESTVGSCHPTSLEPLPTARMRVEMEGKVKGLKGFYRKLVICGSTAPHAAEVGQTIRCADGGRCSTCVCCTHATPCRMEWMDAGVNGGGFLDGSSLSLFTKVISHHKDDVGRLCFHRHTGEHENSW